MDCDKEYVSCVNDGDCSTLCTGQAICGNYGNGIRRCVRREHYETYKRRSHDDNMIVVFAMNRNLGYLEPRNVPVDMVKYAPDARRSPHDVASNRRLASESDERDSVWLHIYGPTTADVTPYEYRARLPRRLLNGLLKCSLNFPNFDVK